MIDFRYHLVSIVAVFLALGIGIIVGSGFLGEPLLDQLRRNVESVRDDNAEYREQIDDLQAGLGAEGNFVEETKAYLTDDALLGRSIVVWRFQGTSDEVTDGVRDSLEEAGATIASMITLTDRFALEGGDHASELGTALRMEVSDPETLRRDAGALLGGRAALAAAAPAGEGRRRALASGGEMFEELLSALVDAGFAELDRGDGAIVPPGSSFVVLGGHRDEPAYRAQEVAVPMALGLAEQTAQVLVATPLEDAWHLIGALRGDDTASAQVSTVDFADLPAGHVAVVLALERALATDTPGHFGVGDGASAMIPSPFPGL